MASGVSINPDGVESFANKMRSDVDGGLSDAASRARDLHVDGVKFGLGLAGSAILHAHDRYRTALENTEANMRTYVSMARALADVANQVAAEFGRADASSAEQQKKVADLLRGGLQKANELQAAADQSLAFARQHVSGV